MIVAASEGEAISVGASDACPLADEGLSMGTGVSTPPAFCSSGADEADELSRASVSSEGFGTLAIGVARREREC